MDYDKVWRSLRDMENKLNDKEAENSKLRQIIEDLKKKLAKAGKMIQATAGAGKQLQSQARQLQIENQRLQDAVRALEGANQEMANQGADLEKELEAAKKEIKRLQGLVKERDDVLAEIKQELDDVTDEKTAALASAKDAWNNNKKLQEVLFPWQLIHANPVRIIKIVAV